MNRFTGRRLTGIDHLRQSIVDIITTPLGSRLERRQYGSLLPELIDQPANASTRVRLYSAVVSALMRWEPRLRITRVGLVAGDRPGQLVLTVEGEYTPTGKAVGLNAAFTARGAAA